MGYGDENEYTVSFVVNHYKTLWETWSWKERAVWFLLKKLRFNSFIKSGKWLVNDPKYIMMDQISHTESVSLDLIPFVDFNGEDCKIECSITQE